MLAPPQSAIQPASTALLFHVEIPATGFDCLLNFAVKPGVALQQVQQGITEVIDELAFRLASSVSEKDLQSNLDKYEVAKLECEQQLQDWQSKLSEASLSVLRADRSRNELSKLRESYWREVQSLRQQLYQKQQAEEQGEDFTPDSVDLFKTKQEDNENELLEQIDRMEEEHKAEIASWKQKNLELVEKLKAKALQASLQRELVAKVMDGIHAKTSDASVQTDHPKLKDASSVTDTINLVSTSIQTIELEAPAMQIDMEVQTDFEESQTGEVEGEQAQAKPSKTRRRSVNGRSASGSRRMSSAPSKEKSRTRSIEVAKDSPDVLNSLEVSPDILGADTTDTSTQTDVAMSAVGPAMTTVATQVDPMQLGMPMTPRTPAGTPRRPRLVPPRQRAETVDVMLNVEDQNQESGASGDGSDGESDSGISNCLLQTWPDDSQPGKGKIRLPGLKTPDGERGDRSSFSGSRSPKPKALSLPTQEDISGKEILFTVSSQGHSAVMSCRSEGARPSKRTINRPRLSSPSQFASGG